MLLTLEGIDGSGKTTAWQGLKERGVCGETALFTSEPTDSWLGQSVRRSLSDPEADPLAELFLFTADHAAHLSNVVGPALDAGRVVVSDRYSDSRYAYQAARLADRVDAPLEYIQSVHERFTIRPDATIYFELPAAEGARRSGATDKMEHEAYLERVAANYERLIAAEPARFDRVDATAPAETVIDRVTELVERRLAGD